MRHLFQETQRSPLFCLQALLPVVFFASICSGKSVQYRLDELCFGQVDGIIRDVRMRPCPAAGF